MTGPSRLAFIEAKSTQTLRPEMAAPVLRLRAAATGREVDCFVVCPGAGPTGHAGLGDGVRGVGIEALASDVLRLRALSPDMPRWEPVAEMHGVLPLANRPTTVSL